MKFARAGYKEKIGDHAAGVLIVQEASGVVTDNSPSNNFSGNGLTQECTRRVQDTLGL